MSEGPNQRILVVDDEADIREVIALSLQDSGYDVTTAADGQAGLECCLTFKPDIIITDIRMPRMDGIAFLEAVKKSQPHVEVIVATAFGDMAMAVKALQLDASDLITKPVSDAALQVALKRARERITTRRRHLEQQMADQASALHQDKMISLGRLAASVAHEINNPLSAVLNYIRLMTRIMTQKSIDDAQRIKFRDYLDIVEKEVVRCAQIVAGLLTFARKSPSTRQPISPEELIGRSLLLSRHRLEMGNITLETAIAPDLTPIDGDANQLQQCLINLIFNAIDAMPDGGRLRVSAARGDDGETIVLTVADSGHGIDSRDLPHIFEPFFTTRKDGRGTGLGLATTFGIVQEHRGTIDVHSSKGNGAVFTIRLPARPQPAGAEKNHRH